MKKFLTDLGQFSMMNNSKKLQTSYIIWKKRFYGLTVNNIQTLDYELAENNNISHNIKTTKKMAGKDWVKLFYKRHPGTALTSPEGSSSTRA